MQTCGMIIKNQLNGGFKMIRYLMKKFALTEQGAKDFLKATINFVLSNLLLLVPVSLLFLLIQDLIDGTIPTWHYYLFGFW